MSSIHIFRHPRPRWNDRQVREAAVPLIHPRLRDWCVRNGVFPQDDPDLDTDLRAALGLTLTECSEPYAAARYLEEFAGLPADADLVLLMGDAYAVMHRLVEDFTAEWVLKSGTRFRAAKGDMIRFKVGDISLSGIVVGVKKGQAAGYVEIVKTKGRAEVIRVLGEDITENLGPRQKKTSGGERA